jgi:hypothetical protein
MRRDARHVGFRECLTDPRQMSFAHQAPKTTQPGLCTSFWEALQLPDDFVVESGLFVLVLLFFFRRGFHDSLFVQT